MMYTNDFVKKQILIYEPYKGDKISYQNDNLVIRDANKQIKYQASCYRIFMLMIIGDTTITTGILRRIQKFGFYICFMTMGLKVYSTIGTGMQGNTLLHQKQYDYKSLDIARHIIINKIQNQKNTLCRMRSKTEYIKEAIPMLDMYKLRLYDDSLSLQEIIGIEGMASKLYFPRVFNNTKWKGRKPRIKFDYINALLDIGYNILFNFIEAILNVFGFDIYMGVLHTCFYMRKSLVCDIMEPFRPIIDWQIRKSINLEQFKEKDFVVFNHQYTLEYQKSTQYTQILFAAILEYKEDIFIYIRDYYRAVMKEKAIDEYPVFVME